MERPKICVVSYQKGTKSCLPPSHPIIHSQAAMAFKRHYLLCSDILGFIVALLQENRSPKASLGLFLPDAMVRCWYHHPNRSALRKWRWLGEDHAWEGEEPRRPVLDYRGPKNSILPTRSSYDLLTSRVIYRQVETSTISLKEQFRAEQSFVRDSALMISFICLPLLGCSGAGTAFSLSPQTNA